LGYRGQLAGSQRLTLTRSSDTTRSQCSVLTGDLRAYETREVTIPPHCVDSDPRIQG
jgi:hypothetical protein